MINIDCEKCFHYRICCGYTSKEAIAESNRAMNNGESLLCFMYAPTADVVEVRHGKWKKVSEKYPRYVCTSCNHLYNNKEYKYCPNCGAKMDEERRDKCE